MGRDSSSRFLDQIIPKRFRSGPIVPVVRLSGVIGLSTPLKPGLSLANVARLLDRAFKFRRARDFGRLSGNRLRDRIGRTDGA